MIIPHELEVGCALHPTSNLLLTEYTYSLGERMFPLVKGGKGLSRCSFN